MTSDFDVKGSSIIVVGCGGHARFVLSMLACSAYNVAGLVDWRDSYDDDEKIMGVAVFGSREDLPRLRVRYNKAVVAIGDNQLRQQVFKQLVALEFEFPNIIHTSAFIDNTSSLGKGNVVGPSTVVGAEVTIGNNNIINSAAVIEHQSIIGNHCHLAPGAVVCGGVSVGDSVLLGANSTVIPQLQIADNTTLGAGSTLLNSQYSVGKKLVGSPAKELQQ